jgi:hypothetical protein
MVFYYFNSQQKTYMELSIFTWRQVVRNAYRSNQNTKKKWFKVMLLLPHPHTKRKTSYSWRVLKARACLDPWHQILRNLRKLHEHNKLVADRLSNTDSNDQNNASVFYSNNKGWELLTSILQYWTQQLTSGNTLWIYCNGEHSINIKKHTDIYNAILNTPNYH